MAKTFLEGVKTPFANLVKSFKVKDKEGKESELSYLPWPRALALAGRPRQEVRYWNGLPYFSLFGGLVVAVSQPLDDDPGTPTVMQDMFLPILDGASRPIPIARVDPRDVTDTINRARAKSAASVSGVGLSLYSKGNRDTVKFLVDLKVKPTSDLSTIEPLIVKKEGKGAYIDWPSSLAAARITDPDFHWEIEWHEVVDKNTGAIERMPALQAGTGWAVTVKLTYRGQSHTEMLPIMGQVMIKTKNGDKLMDHQAILNPTVHDWNRAVMRCLVKGIAIITGYGLSVYANEDVASLHVDPLGPPPAAEKEKQPDPTPEPEFNPALHAELVTQVTSALAAKGKNVKGLVTWLGRPEVDALDKLSLDELKRSLIAVAPSPTVTH
jgi:hypothetical protein